MTTVVLFTCFAAASFAGLFSKIEARFYEPAKIAGIRKQLDAIAESSDGYITMLLDAFGIGEGAFITHRAIRSYALQSPDDSDVQERTQRTGELFATTPGLDGIRLIDYNGRNIHFSTYSTDIIRQTDMLRMYKNYDEVKTPQNETEFPFSVISVAADSVQYRITFDGNNNRMLFSFPFYDTYSVYRGTIIFYVNAQDLNRTLLTNNIITVGESGTLLSDESGALGGFLFGMPSIGRNAIENKIVSAWQKDSTGPDKIIALEADAQQGDNSYLVLLSSNSSQFMKIAGIYSDSVFILPHTMQLLLLVCAFITLLLIIFMLFNLHRDDMVVIRDRIKRLQLGIINEYLSNKESVDWDNVISKIASRKTDVSATIKKSLGRRAKKHEQETDALIDKSWEEIINALTIKRTTPSSPEKNHTVLIGTEDLRKMLEDILQSGGIKVQAVAEPRVIDKGEVHTFHANNNSASDMSKNIAAVEPRELLDNVTTVEDVQDAELLDAGDEIGDAELLDEVDEVDDAVQPHNAAAPLHKIETRNDAPLLDNVTTVEDVQDAELLDAGDEIDDAELLDEVDEVDDAAQSPQANNLIDDFSVVPTPNFLYLDDEEENGAQSDIVSKIITEQFDSTDVLPLAGEQLSAPFAFTEFAADSPHVQNLMSASDGAITCDADGVYTISTHIEYEGIVQDKSLKALIDSVLH
ncbi:MAG: hypothetical protein J6I73_06960 [Treponema sp.]|nr:hypothetical protein [Treponema sp.]